MSKAALNMITETEAVSAWKGGRVAINSVDPGFMSADPVWMEMVGRKEQKQPLAWEDGAGRVLWPIAKGEGEGTAIWGRFLKHFSEINVNK
jgi:NAD(P)-dependent dehydrogenase (short-subunit alcohol dehydrogenase family)